MQNKFYLGKKQTLPVPIVEETWTGNSVGHESARVCMSSKWYFFLHSFSCRMSVNIFKIGILESEQMNFIRFTKIQVSTLKSCTLEQNLYRSRVVEFLSACDFMNHLSNFHFLT